MHTFEKCFPIQKRETFLATLFRVSKPNASIFDVDERFHFVPYFFLAKSFISREKKEKRGV